MMMVTAVAVAAVTARRGAVVTRSAPRRAGGLDAADQIVLAGDLFGPALGTLRRRVETRLQKLEFGAALRAHITKKRHITPPYIKS